MYVYVYMFMYANTLSFTLHLIEYWSDFVPQLVFFLESFETSSLTK